MRMLRSRPQAEDIIVAENWMSLPAGRRLGTGSIGPTATNAELWCVVQAKP